MSSVFMRKLFLLILILPLWVNSQTPTHLKVHFENPSKDSCMIAIENEYIDEYITKYKYSRSGVCEVSTPISAPVICRLAYDRQLVTIFLEPGDDLDINILHDNTIYDLTCTGKGAENNIFLSSFYKEFYSDFDPMAMKDKMLNTALDAYEMWFFDQRKKQLAFYNKQDKSKFSKAFNDYMEATIKYQYYGNLLSYPITNANQSTTILKVNAIPEVMLEGVTSKLINDEALISDRYREFINYYVIYYTSKGNGFNKFTDYNSSMERKVMHAKSNLTGKTLIWYIANFLNKDCNLVAPYTVKIVYGQLQEIEKNGIYTQLLKSKCEARMKAKDTNAKNTTTPSGTVPSAQSGYKNPFEGVVLKDLTGKVYNTNQLEGKVVFVDFWASWCGPCRQEFPYSKLLHDRFTEKELKKIVFLYISIDGNETSWKNAVQVIGMKGTLVISPGDWSSPIVSYFGINSIPRYMLIDKDGKIAAPNANRPSSGDQIYNDIQKLLAQ